MGFDPTRSAGIQANQAKKQENAAYNRHASISLSLGNQMLAAPRDPRWDVIEVLLGDKQPSRKFGEQLAQALQAIGVQLGQDDQSASGKPHDLLANNGDKVAPRVNVMDKNGNLDKTLDMTKDRARDEYDRLVGMGYARPTQDGLVVELRPKEASQGLGNGNDPELPVYDKDDKHDTNEKVKYSTGTADVEHYEYRPAAGSKPERFVKKPYWRFGH